MKISWLFLGKIMLTELCIYGSYMLIKAEGLRTLRTQYQTQFQLQHDIHQLSQEHDKLAKAQTDWNAYPFLTEKQVREQLQYMNPQDELYLYIS